MFDGKGKNAIVRERINEAIFARPLMIAFLPSYLNYICVG